MPEDKPNPDVPRESPLSRRYLLKLAIGTSLLGSGALAYAWRVEPHWVQVVQRELPIHNLPAQLVGRSLVQISDLHIGPVVDDRYMCSALKQVSRLQPDILVITGDFMTLWSHPWRSMQRPGFRSADIARPQQTIHVGRV